MTNLTMYDTAYDNQFPLGAQAYAAYVDGGIGSQPNYDFIVQAFPKAHHLSIALSHDHDADALDVENGAASPQDVPGWHARQKARGVERPCVYASAFTMQDGILPVLQSAGIARPSVRLWSAHYGDGLHICGPGSCRQVSVDMDGTQWTPNAMNRDLDRSLLRADFFGAPPVPKPPADWTYSAPLHLAATGGHESVRLTWDAPAGAPEPPAAYDVFIYRGTAASRATIVDSYPRAVTETEFEGGSLELGRTYTAHVVASGPGGTRTRPYCYVSVTFRTG